MPSSTCQGEMSSSSTYEDLLPRAIPNFALPPLSASSRAIVIGMGGGCDVFAAAALSRLWQMQPSTEAGASVLFANCIGPRPLLDDHEPLTPHLYRLPREPVPLVPGDEAYGSTRLEQSLPRGAEGSPFLIVVPKDGKSGLPIEEVTAANTAAFCGALEHLKVTTILAVDLGGDSLTGGIDFDGGSFEFGRDRQVLHALSASSIPFVQLVFGPGCDGESTIDAMQKAVKAADDSGALLGVLLLHDLVPEMSEMARTLRSSRTPNILARALAKAEGSAPAEDETEKLCVIERHGNRAEIPWSWLSVALAIKHNGV